MNTPQNSLADILAELAVIRAREKDLLCKMAALLDARPQGVRAHVVQVFLRAKDVFGQDAARFLAAPHWELGHEMPISVALDPEGARRVEDLLGRIVHGIPA